MDLPWLDHAARSPAGMPPAARSLRLLAVDGARRAAVEDFVRARFAAHYQAQVRHFMPRLFALEAADGSLHGAVGCRAAAEQELFLERYLDEPVERVIARRAGARIERDGIVEVGNLAAHGAGTARLLIIALTRILAAEGLRWVCFTGTPGLINSFRRLGLEPLTLGPADPRRMGAELPEWGSYYEAGPLVMAGEIPGGERALAGSGRHLRPERGGQLLAGCA
jgi:hypothetical protein